MKHLWPKVVDRWIKLQCRVHGMVDDHNYTPIGNIMFNASVGNVVSDQEIVNAIWLFMDDLKNLVSETSTVPKYLRTWMSECQLTRNQSSQTEASILLNVDKHVQITASKSEIDRRIQAFIQKKRMETDAFNRREFCQVHDSPDQSSCARTDATFVPRQSEKSLLKISRVQNEDLDKNDHPPKTKLGKMKTYPLLHPSSTIPYFRNTPEVKERLTNISNHVNRTKGGYQNNQNDVYKQIKTLEERILYLESMSPEYFMMQNGRNKPGIDTKNISPTKEHFSNEIKSPVRQVQTGFLDMRMAELRSKLLEKAQRRVEQE